MTSENTSLRLTIESLAPDGLGLAHVEGFPLKFAGTLPGEEVMVSIDRTKRPWRGEVLD
ncbi:MAG: TRAM domain-containing protein, partial [Sutterella sp.]